MVSAKSAMYRKQAQLFAATGDEYFDIARDEVLRLVPPTATKILEVGCASGATLLAIKEERRQGGGLPCEVVGVDIEQASVDLAATRLDCALRLDAEEDDFTAYPPGYFDLLIMHYVLEHVVNPWETLRKWLATVRIGGHVIIGVPNISNYAYLKRVVVHDEHVYEPAGVLDWTHLRYFTKTTLTRLLEEAGLRVVQVDGIPRVEDMRRRVRWILRVLPRGRRFAHYGFVALAQKVGETPAGYVPFVPTYTL